jgi:uncharacterized protein with HEPN domain
MSDPVRPGREWRFYIDDMIGFAEKVLTYTEDMDQASFTASGITYDAVLRNLELIGEASTHIPDGNRSPPLEILTENQYRIHSADACQLAQLIRIGWGTGSL